MSAWVKQIASQVAKHGSKHASWYAEWDEPTGKRRCKSCGSGPDGKRLAKLLAEKISAELSLGTYESNKSNRTTWDTFVKEYSASISDRATKTISESEVSLSHFKRLLKLKDAHPIASITTKDVDKFAQLRREERGKKKGSTISAATVNKDLRTLKAAFNRAHKWKYLKEMPEFQMQREPKKLPNFVTDEHFAAILIACDNAEKPRGMVQYTPAEWWKGLIAFAYMTGWRIGEILALKWSDVDLDAGIAITRAADNKGGRDEAIKLHDVLIAILNGMKTDDEYVFPWSHDRRTLDTEFHRIQSLAIVKDKEGNETKMKLECRESHECTGACHAYGFHDFRRAFATKNALNMTREALQALMRHSSPLTTAGYINYANQVSPAVANLHVPDALK